MGSVLSVCRPGNREDFLDCVAGYLVPQKNPSSQVAPELVACPAQSQAPGRGTGCRQRFGARTAVLTDGIRTLCSLCVCSELWGG